jgi:hypothetical protein
MRGRGLSVKDKMIPFGLLIIILASGCAIHEDLEVSKKTYVVQQTIKKDWCYLDGKAVNGWVKAQEKYYEICVSLNSDMPSRTLDHELSHIALHSLGMNMHVID